MLKRRRKGIYLFFFLNYILNVGILQLLRLLNLLFYLFIFIVLPLQWLFVLLVILLRGNLFFFFWKLRRTTKNYVLILWKWEWLIDRYLFQILNTNILEVLISTSRYIPWSCFMRVFFLFPSEHSWGRITKKVLILWKLNWKNDEKGFDFLEIVMIDRQKPVPRTYQYFRVHFEDLCHKGFLLLLSRDSGLWRL